MTHQEFHSFVVSCKGLRYGLTKCPGLRTGQHLTWLLAQTSGRFVAQVQLWKGDTRHAVAVDMGLSPPLLYETDPAFPRAMTLASCTPWTLKLVGIVDVLRLSRVVDRWPPKLNAPK